jgi:hypothetical protein
VDDRTTLSHVAREIAVAADELRRAAYAEGTDELWQHIARASAHVEIAHRRTAAYVPPERPDGVSEQATLRAACRLRMTGLGD